MRTTFKWLLILSLGLALLGLFAGGALWHTLIAQPDVSISINGEDLDFEGLHSVPWFGVVFGMLAAGAVVCLVIPLVLLFSVGLPLLLTLAILAAVAVGLLSLGAMLFSPLILLVLLLLIVLRKKRPKSPPQAASIDR
jgi:hypothetical protein